jgi:hypothetical protein
MGSTGPTVAVALAVVEHMQAAVLPMEHERVLPPSVRRHRVVARKDSLKRPARILGNGRRYTYWIMGVF